MKIKINPVTNIFNQLPSGHNLVMRTKLIADLLEGKTIFYDCENARDLDILKVNETWQAKNGQHVLSVDVRDAGKTRVITMRANRIARINGEDARVVKVGGEGQFSATPNIDRLKAYVNNPKKHMGLAEAPFDWNNKKPHTQIQPAGDSWATR